MIALLLGSVSASALLLTGAVELDYSSAFVVLGRGPDSAAINRSKTFTVLGGKADAETITRSKTFVILE